MTHMTCIKILKMDYDREKDECSIKISYEERCFNEEEKGTQYATLIFYGEEEIEEFRNALFIFNSDFME
jgi:hypothetical protein